MLSTITDASAYFLLIIETVPPDWWCSVGRIGSLIVVHIKQSKAKKKEKENCNQLSFFIYKYINHVLIWPVHFSKIDWKCPFLILSIISEKLDYTTLSQQINILNIRVTVEFAFFNPL